MKAKAATTMSHNCQKWQLNTLSFNHPRDRHIIQKWKKKMMPCQDNLLGSELPHWSTYRVSHRLSDTINSRTGCRSSCRRHTESWMLQLYFSPSNPDTVLEGPHRISASSLRGGKDKFRTQVYSEESIQRRTRTQINFLQLERSTAQLHAMLQRWGRTRSQTNEARGCAHAHNEGSATFFADGDDDQDLGLD